MTMMFNPNPRIEVVRIGDRPVCYVIDDALVDPQRWVDHAAARADAFEETDHNAYPGPELRMPDADSAQLDAFFSMHLRRAFDVRRTLRMYSRMALATRQPEQLAPRQWLCHVDRMDIDPGQAVIASVLYLFRDESLGGTGFYRPLRPLPEIAQAVQDSARLSGTEFTARHGLAAGYMTASNTLFEKIAVVPARWNRLVFYSGMIFHAADITAPERLSRDPRVGRLTLNGFFTCRRNAG
ncbi:DUF6445 family protein [Lysobacter fragariae]